MDKAWKKFERRVAYFFADTRNALSGRNSKQTASDTLHPMLFIECKQRKHLTTWTLWKKTLKLANNENKIAVLAQHEVDKKGFLITVHNSQLDAFIKHYLKHKYNIEVTI